MVTFCLGFHLSRHPKALKTSAICGLFWGADLLNLGFDEMQFDPATHPLHLDIPIEKSTGWKGILSWEALDGSSKCKSLELCKDSMYLHLKYQVRKIQFFSRTLPKISWKQLEKTKNIHPSEWFSFGYRLWLRQPEANATIGKHVGLLVAPVKSKDRAQAKVMTDYKEDQAAGNWATFEMIFSFQGTITYPLPVCTLESMILRRSPRWDMRSFPGGYRNPWDFWKDLKGITVKDISSIISRRKHAGFDQKKKLFAKVEIMGSLLFVFETLINS